MEDVEEIKNEAENSDKNKTIKEEVENDVSDDNQKKAAAQRKS
jgi:hypothetical protein